MQKVIVTIHDPANAKLFLKMVEQLNFVESAKIEDTEYDWINPSRPATDEECEQMIAKAEQSPSMSAEAAQAYSLKLSKDRDKAKTKSSL